MVNFILPGDGVRVAIRFEDWGTPRMVDCSRRTGVGIRFDFSDFDDDVVANCDDGPPKTDIDDVCMLRRLRLSDRRFFEAPIITNDGSSDDRLVCFDELICSLKCAKTKNILEIFFSTRPNC